MSSFLREITKEATNIIEDKELKPVLSYSFSKAANEKQRVTNSKQQTAKSK